MSGKSLFLVFCALAVFAILYGAFGFGNGVSITIPSVHMPPTVQNVVTILTTPR